MATKRVYYFGGGHGGYRLIVLAPHSVQEMYSLTMLAFDLADAVGRKNAERSLLVLGRLVQEGEQPVGLLGSR